MTTFVGSVKWDLNRCHYEVCSYCNSFEAVKKFGGDKYICQNCNESSSNILLNSRQKKSSQNANTNERIKTKRTKRDDTKGAANSKKEISIRSKRSHRVDSSRAALMTFLNQNSCKAYNTLELIEKFPNFNSKVIRNSLGQMVREGDIYSRVISINGRKLYSIYSVTESKIEELLDDETSAQILETIRKNTYSTTKTLVAALNLSDYNIRRVIKRSLSEDVKIFENKGMYYFIDAKDEEKIKFFKKKYCSARVINQTYFRN